MDDPKAYRWHVDRGYAVLDKKADGSCFYLAADGCSIHDKAPSICKRMDCRALYTKTAPEMRAARELQNPQMVHVYAAGRDRLHTLKD